MFTASGAASTSAVRISLFSGVVIPQDSCACAFGVARLQPRSTVRNLSVSTRGLIALNAVPKWKSVVVHHERRGVVGVTACAYHGFQAAFRLLPAVMKLETVPWRVPVRSRSSAMSRPIASIRVFVLSS